MNNNNDCLCFTCLESLENKTNNSSTPIVRTSARDSTPHIPLCICGDCNSCRIADLFDSLQNSDIKNLQTMSHISSDEEFNCSECGKYTTFRNEYREAAAKYSYKPAPLNNQQSEVITITNAADTGTGSQVYRTRLTNHLNEPSVAITVGANLKKFKSVVESAFEDWQTFEQVRQTNLNVLIGGTRVSVKKFDDNRIFTGKLTHNGFSPGKFSICTDNNIEIIFNRNDVFIKIISTDSE